MIAAGASQIGRPRVVERLPFPFDVFVGTEGFIRPFGCFLGRGVFFVRFPFRLFVLVLSYVLIWPF
jgi:hypothetical protein